MTPDQFLKLLNEKPQHPTAWIKSCLSELNLSKDVQDLNDKALIQENEQTFQKLKVTSLKKYDVIRVQTLASSHYLLVHRVKDETVYGLVITSKEACWTVCQIENDRRFKGSFVSNTYMCFPLSECLNKFITVYEDKREANKIFKIVKEYFKSIFK